MFTVYLPTGKKYFGLDDVYIVLEDDGTEVDEEEYFQMLPDKSLLMILAGDQIWTPSFTIQA